MSSSTSPQRKKVLITVKTYPTLSSKYDELVCTAGITEDGEWIRLYPIPYRQLESDKQYKKYQWIELDVVKNTSDPRPESFRPVNLENLEKLEEIDTADKWLKRKNIVLKKVYDDLSLLITENKEDKGVSLAVFKPTKILDFVIEECSREWDKLKLKDIKARSKQMDLFGEKNEDPFKIVRKIPYKFSYIFEDRKGVKSKIMIEDWELGQLFWNCLKRENQNEKIACEKVKQKYLNEFSEKDLHFYMGTTRQFDGWSKNPFLIIGAFYPPQDNRNTLF